jgi:hypothetical protein
MPYLIETYSAGRLVNIDTGKQFTTFAEAKEEIKRLIEEQINDNEELMSAYYERLYEELSDEGYNDRTIHIPKMYNYKFHMRMYSSEEILLIP